MLNEDDLVKAHRHRADLIGNIVLFCFAVIISRLWYLQVYKGSMFAEYSLQNRLRKEILKAPRGVIFDRNNQVLVHNSPRFDIVLIPQYLRDTKETIQKLAQVFKITEESLANQLKKFSGQASYVPVVIKKNATPEEVAIIETEHYKLPGVKVNIFISREYNDREVGAHLLGYISEISKEKLIPYRKRDGFSYQSGDFIGVSGIEKMLDLEVRGQDGHELVEVDARGRMKRYMEGTNIIDGIENKDPISGENIRLTVDNDLQNAAFTALEGKTGGAVAIDVHTGEVLAMVSRPSFDPSKFSKELTKDYWSSLVANELNPLRDRNIQEHYPPGSTFKMIAAVAALEEGIIDENTEYVCPGYFKLGRRVVHCWKKHGHQKVNITKAIRESCDVFFYKVASKIDIDTLSKYANMLGFGSKTGITLPGEIAGLVPTKEWKLKRSGEEWQKGETLSCIIGQSYVLATPLQMVMAYSVIANGGTLYRPYVVKEIFENSGKIHKSFAPEEISKIKLSQKTLDYVKRGLYEVVNDRKGTGWWSRGKGIMMAGKTGTSQVIKMSAEKLFDKCEEQEYKYRNHGLFIGYAPADDPKIAVASIVEHGCHGASAAAPVVRDIIQVYMKKYHPEKQSAIIEMEKKEYLAKKRIEDAQNAIKASEEESGD